MATKYPQYQIGQWIDTSEEAMNKPQATILYGVQIRPEKGAKWMHCCRGGEPLLFDTPEEASALIAELKGLMLLPHNATLSGSDAAGGRSA